jgi:hypothetical protein
LTLGGTYGIVEYHNIYALRDVERSSGWGHKRPMFVLWRTEAYDVGLLQNFYAGAFGAREQQGPLRAFVKDDYDRRTLRDGLALLDNFQHEAAVARKYIKPRLQAAENREAFLKDVWITYELADYSKVEVERNYRRVEVYGAPKWVTGLRRVGTAIENCRWIASEMTGTPILNRVGEALLHYLDEGLLLADVHQGNIGVSDDNELIITDPGHVVEIHPRWAGPVEITEI